MDAMMKVMGDMQKQIEKAQKEQIAEQKELRKLIERQQSGVLRDLKGAGAADADPRVQMWELIMKATSLPNGKPESEQLAALWDKYDPDGKWELSKEKLKLILQDQANAKVQILLMEIPKVKTKLAEQTKGDPFAGAMEPMVLGALEGQLKMHELQAKGEIGEDHINLIFDQLDKNHDHHVSKAEFLERAADVFLAEQMQVQRMQAAMQSGAGQPMFIGFDDGPGDCNQQ